MKLIKYILQLTLLILAANSLRAQQAAIIPKPLEMDLLKGRVGFTLNEKTVIITDKAFLADANILAAYLKDITGDKIRIVDNKAGLSNAGFTIRLQKDHSGEIPREGYHMHVADNQVEIRASHSAGAYYGAMSLLQAITRVKVSNKFTVAAMQVVDYPRFEWRGFMLDCSRTFMSFEYLKKTVDRMAFYKLNKLHLHLTDDQGWRLEIKKYPLLTKKGAFFDPKYNEPKEFSGFYTQAQMRELVKYASERHIDVIPEIECPGHSHAALYAYPELACTDEVSSIHPSFGGKLTKDARGNVRVYNPCKESTYTFFKDVIGEVADVFPASYIHLGGDEVDEGSWKDCTDCVVVTDSLKIKNDTKSLQRMMMDRVSNFVIATGKQAIGWDEVFETGVKNDFVVQLWRGTDKAIQEVKAGHKVILSPKSNLYFDYSYRVTPTEKVYLFDPIPEGLTPEEEQRYLGIESCFWSDVNRSESKVDYQVYPRLLAMAERAWSDKNVKDYQAFRQRWIIHQFWFGYFGINCAC